MGHIILFARANSIRRQNGTARTFDKCRLLPVLAVVRCGDTCDAGFKADPHLGSNLSFKLNW